MLTKTVITLLGLYDGNRPDIYNRYDLARLQLSGLVDENNELTDHGCVICLEILTYVEKVL